MKKYTNLISLDQIEAGNDLSLSIKELYDKVKDINPKDYRLISELIKASDLDPDLYKLIEEKASYDDTEITNSLKILEELKANRSELLDYRRLDIDIAITDLTKELQNKINGLYDKGYEDEWIVTEFARLEKVKLNRNEAKKFRSTDIPIGLNDLDFTLHDLLNDIQTIIDTVNKLEEIAVDKEYILENFRRKVIDINYDDLSVDLQTRLNTYSESTHELSDVIVNIEENITDIFDKLDEKADIVEMNLKADKTEVELKADIAYVDNKFREKAVLITIKDLEEEIANKINNISSEFNSDIVLSAIDKLQKDKADKAYLDNFLRRTDPIAETDLDERLIEKINRAIDRYDDTDVITHIKNLQKQKVDIRDLQNYRKKNESIVLDDLDRNIQIMLRSNADNNAELKSIIASIKYLQDNKLSLEEALKLFIKKDELIVSYDNLDTHLTNLINNILSTNSQHTQQIESQRQTIEEQKSIIVSLEERVRFNELEIENIKNKLGMN